MRYPVPIFRVPPTIRVIRLPLSYTLFPHSRYIFLALGAFSVGGEFVFRDAVTHAANQARFALGAVGVLSLGAPDVADEAVAHAAVGGYLRRALEGFLGRDGEVAELVAGTEARKMDRHVAPQVLDDPAAEALDGADVVV